MMVLSHADVRALTVFNPIAGSGRAERLARDLVAELNGAVLPSGKLLEIQTLPSQPTCASLWLDPVLAEYDLLIVVGGDGACRQAAASAIRANIPLYHYPSGTENLFARDHGMRPDPHVLLEALTHGERRRVDVLRVGDELGLLFASVGFDAQVVHDLAEHRSGSISHASYLGPILRQLAFWHRTRSAATITVDQTRLVSSRHGSALVANSPQYAMRLNPAPDALPDDGVLDVAFLPSRTLFGVLFWAVWCRVRTARSNRKILRALGHHIVVELDQPAVLQIDGDPPQSLEPDSRYEIRIEPAALSLLVPPSENPAI